MRTLRPRPRAAGAALLALGATVTLALPTAAGAATRTVEVGPFGRADQRAFQGALADANTFFRRVTTIRQGDRVSWKLNGFHTITFVPRGDIAPGLIAPDAANPIADSLDAAGAPFWFNGLPRLVINPLAGERQGGSNFDPDELHNSGQLLSQEAPKPYKLKFNRKGRFDYLCVVHPGMEATVRVVGRRASIPSAAAHRRAAKREQQILLRRAQRRSPGVGVSQRENTVQAGNDERSGVSIFKFFPGNLRVDTGTTVELRMAPRTTEVHTFSFGPSNGRDAYLDQIAEAIVMPVGGGDGPPAAVFEPRIGYPSENPQDGVPGFDGSNHGNGFFNSGILDGLPQSPVPNRVRLRFTKAGTYPYICFIHPFMKGRVTVTD